MHSMCLSLDDNVVLHSITCHNVVLCRNICHCTCGHKATMVPFIKKIRRESHRNSVEKFLAFGR